MTVTLPAPTVDSDWRAVCTLAADALKARAGVDCPLNVRVKVPPAPPTVTA
jgi:hypothetical protein